MESTLTNYSCMSAVRFTSDAAVPIDDEAVQRWRRLGRVFVVVVGPAGDGVAAYVGVGNAGGLDGSPNPSLSVVEAQCRLHRVRLVDVVPELRRQEPLPRQRKAKL